MFVSPGLLGCHCEDMANVINTSSKLNNYVVEKINESQELCMLKVFDQESNEYRLKKSFENRISEISSWRWVLEDLARRLAEAVMALDHEQQAVSVIIDRIQAELDVHSRYGSRPGALKPCTDEVEDAILKEYTLLCDQRRNFKKMTKEILKNIFYLNKTKNRIESDLLGKEETIAIEVECLNREVREEKAVKRRKTSPLSHWQGRCESLKAAGLKALSNAVCTREQVRQTRVHLTIAAQADAARVDAALRRRLHGNQVQLEELRWQKQEASRDSKTLDIELSSSEVTLLDVIDRIRLLEARLGGRKLRPAGEVTSDDVTRRLRDEHGRLKRAVHELNVNIRNIKHLQQDLDDTIVQITCCCEDLVEVINLDRHRIHSRQGDAEDCPPRGTNNAEAHHNTFDDDAQRAVKSLSVIKEEDEDDYPFDN